MSKNIHWYSIEDGSRGACLDTDLIIIDADAMTPEEAQLLYQADLDGDPTEIADAIWSIYVRQNPEATVCG
ncbi:hypothetical protein UFOVP929_50 [uncultured Caudovirales phage]|uniref:Uncharacterized protein n=1 Tax=uncultured Caudovirales phage TaxID=2100421 RepID=A0A6J5PS50_9CAUD|nr:hypothetical protein UFOVP929_50 [uncultured Caudovirales phage]